MTAAWIFRPSASISVNTNSPIILTTVSDVVTSTTFCTFCRLLAIFALGEKQGLFRHVSDTPRRGVAAPRLHEGHPPDGGLSLGVGLFRGGCTSTTWSPGCSGAISCMSCGG